MTVTTADNRWMRASMTGARWLGVVVAIVATLGLLGWWANIPQFKSVGEGLAQMKPNTALGLLACGIGLAAGIRGPALRKVRAACGGLAMTLGVVTLAEHLFQTGDVIDTLLIGGTRPDQAAVVRMTPGSAFGLTCAGLCMVLTGTSWPHPRSPRRAGFETALSLLAMSLGTLALLGYLYGVSSLYNTVVFSTMAVHTASMFVLVGLGLSLSRPDQGLAKLVGSSGTGGVMARRLLGFFVVLAPLLGWFCLRGLKTEWYDAPFSLAMLVMSMMVVGIAMVWSTAVALNKADELRTALQEDLAASVSREHATAAQRGSILDALPPAIALLNVEGRVVALNRRWKSVSASPTVQAGVGQAFVPWAGGVLGAEERAWAGVAAGVAGVLNGDRTGHLSEHRVTPRAGEQPDAEPAAAGVDRNRWLEVRVTPVLGGGGSRAPGSEGQPTGAVVMVSDVTERRKLEEQLVHSQRLDAVGRLAGGVAHDFNNLLTAVTGHRALAQAAIEAGRDAQESLEAIEQAARSGAELTQQLLAFGRRQILSPKVVNVSDLIADVRRLIERSLGETVSLRVVVPRDVWPTNVDPGRIEQVLMNMVINARDAITQRGLSGAVVIEAGNAVLDERYAADRPGVTPGAYVCVSISDTGVGMSAAVMARLFEPFFTTKEHGRGTGLGLATSFGIVKQHGGHIATYSEEGRGTTFRVFLPAAQGASVERQHPLVESKSHRGSERILLVDDHAGARAAVAGMLTSLGYSVIQAGDLAEAERLARAEGTSLDLLLCDVVLPDGKGPELAAKLPDWCPNAAVLYISGYTANAIVNQGVLQEGVQFLSKPFNMNDLGTKVREVLKARVK